MSYLQSALSRILVDLTMFAANIAHIFRTPLTLLYRTILPALSVAPPVHRLDSATPLSQAPARPRIRSDERGSNIIPNAGARQFAEDHATSPATPSIQICILEDPRLEHSGSGLACVNVSMGTTIADVLNLSGHSPDGSKYRASIQHFPGVDASTNRKSLPSARTNYSSLVALELTSVAAAFLGIIVVSIISTWFFVQGTKYRRARSERQSRSRMRHRPDPSLQESVSHSSMDPSVAVHNFPLEALTTSWVNVQTDTAMHGPELSSLQYPVSDEPLDASIPSTQCSTPETDVLQLGVNHHHKPCSVDVKTDKSNSMHEGTYGTDGATSGLADDSVPFADFPHDGLLRTTSTPQQPTNPSSRVDGCLTDEGTVIASTVTAAENDNGMFFSSHRPDSDTVEDVKLMPTEIINPVTVDVVAETSSLASLTTSDLNWDADSDSDEEFRYPGYNPDECKDALHRLNVAEVPPESRRQLSQSPAIAEVATTVLSSALEVPASDVPSNATAQFTSADQHFNDSPSSFEERPLRIDAGRSVSANALEATSSSVPSIIEDQAGDIDDQVEGLVPDDPIQLDDGPDARTVESRASSGEPIAAHSSEPNHSQRDTLEGPETPSPRRPSHPVPEKTDNSLVPCDSATPKVNPRWTPYPNSSTTLTSVAKINRRKGKAEVPFNFRGDQAGYHWKTLAGGE